jgi:hypothetical protein
VLTLAGQPPQLEPRSPSVPGLFLLGNAIPDGPSEATELTSRKKSGSPGTRAAVPPEGPVISVDVGGFHAMTAHQRHEFEYVILR